MVNIWRLPKSCSLPLVIILSSMFGWWFGTFGLFFHSVGNVIIPTDFHSIIFQRGRPTTNHRIFHRNHLATGIPAWLWEPSTEVGPARRLSRTLWSVVRGGAGAAIWEGTGSTLFFFLKVPTYGGGFLSHGGYPKSSKLRLCLIYFDIWDLWFWGIPILRTQMGGESPMPI